VRLAASAAVAIGASFLLAGCGSDSKSSGPTTGGSVHRDVSVKITDAGCEPAKLAVKAGPTTFKVENDGAAKVTEYEVLDGATILGEAENIAPGLSGKFSLTLKPGTYTLYCPGGTTSERGTLEVTGTGVAASAAATAAVATYRRYVEEQTAELVDQTTKFANAVKAGNLAEAKRLYPAARKPYERIEPVAESFGDLDPAIDAREGDVDPADWTGFHPLEKALWKTRSLEDTAPLADQLVQDVQLLDSRVRTMSLEAAQIANGSVELLGEVSKSKITGEEERYSHIDLVDVEANVDGAKAGFDAVRPIVAKKNRQLAETIDARFVAMTAALDKYRDANASSGYVPYTRLTPAQTRELSRSVDALAEPLSRVGAIVVASG
jgi:iron uptake system component EfeO